jgi:hypothetical protein
MNKLNYPFPNIQSILKIPTILLLALAMNGSVTKAESVPTASPYELFCSQLPASIPDRMHISCVVRGLGELGQADIDWGDGSTLTKTIGTNHLAGHSYSLSGRYDVSAFLNNNRIGQQNILAGVEQFLPQIVNQ